MVLHRSIFLLLPVLKKVCYLSLFSLYTFLITVNSILKFTQLLLKLLTKHALQKVVLKTNLKNTHSHCFGNLLVNRCSNTRIHGLVVCFIFFYKNTVNVLNAVPVAYRWIRLGSYVEIFNNVKQ